MARKSRLALAAVIVVAIASAAILWGNDSITEGSPTPSLVYLRAIGTEEGPGHLRQPVGVAVTQDGEVFVTDAGNQRISVFDAGQGGLGELHYPTDVAIGPEG